SLRASEAMRALQGAAPPTLDPPRLWDPARLRPHPALAMRNRRARQHVAMAWRPDAVRSPRDNGSGERWHCQASARRFARCGDGETSGKSRGLRLARRVLVRETGGGTAGVDLPAPGADDVQEMREANR